MNLRKLQKRWYKYVKKRSKPYRDRLGLAWDRASFSFRHGDITLFHEFDPPPGGGAHQFLRALWQEFEQQGLSVENNTFSHTTRACLFNSFNFDFQRLRQWRHITCRMVHRVDGPIGVYRGQDDGTDAKIYRINQEFADATIFQSRYSLQKHLDLGLTFKSPHVIRNTVDSTIFHARGRIPFDRDRKIRLISSSWSDNPNKGFAIYQWLEEHLDWERFEYTFAGRSPIRFERIQILPPVGTDEIASLLRQHDIYITASQHESCSNSLLEALACGLPALYIQSGSNAELVEKSGLGFAAAEELPELLDCLVEQYPQYQSSISIPSLTEVAKQYLAVMGIT